MQRRVLSSCMGLAPVLDSRLSHSALLRQGPNSRSYSSLSLARRWGRMVEEALVMGEELLLFD